MNLTPEELAKPFRLRIPPTSPRNAQRFTDGRRFEKNPKKRWYPISEDDKKRFEKCLLFEANPASPKLFQIVTADQAREIDRQEGVAGADAEQRAAAREAKLQAELDKAHTKIDEQAGALANLTAGQSRLEQLLAQLLESQQQSQSSNIPMINASIEKNDVRADEAKVEAKAETKADAKPARPGERRDGKKQPKAETKEPSDEHKAEAKETSDAEVSAVDAYDSSLKAEGFTPNR